MINGTTTRPCPANAVVFLVVKSDGAPTRISYLDILMREVRQVTESLDGRSSIVDTVYDARGRIASKSEPYYAGDTVYWTSITYDVLNRPVVTTRPDSSTQSVVYNGRIQVSTNENGQTKTVENDALGRLTRVTDAQGNITTYAYDALDQLVLMTDPLGNAMTTSYDIRGNKTAMSDPDRGAWSYRTNALGMLVEQTDAKGIVTRMTYDALGRMLTRTDDATGTPQTATWEYDTATKGIGKLTRTYNAGYQAVSSYDSLGRPSSVTETIDGTAYTVTTGYDAYSRPSTLTYPSGFAAKNVYAASGHLSEVQYASSGAKLWEATQMDARGNITRFRLGNGAESIRTHDAENGRITSIYSTHGGSVVQDLTYVFDAVGNLTQRSDARQGYTEDAVYDNLNRVIQVNTQTGVAPADTGLYLPASMWNGTSTSIAVTYNVLGNITSKTDIGTYGYGETRGACSSVTGAVASAGPRAVSSTSGTSTADYCYDANGNLLSGDGRSVTWTAFGKPERITRGSNTVDISYGPDRARYKRVDTSATSTTTTRYIGGKLYEAIDRAGALEQKHYIGGFAVITVHVATSVTETRYMLTDHLGSVDTIMEASGSVVERMSFDPWGKRRQVNWVPINDPAGYMPLVTTRGFTNHEQLDTVGLVHMNGRVYDPELGRFLSADIVVQDVTNLQAWNAYSYVLNNPLSMTDPTGFFFKAIFKAIGNFFKAIFRAVGSVLRAIAQIPIVGAIIKIATCGIGGPVGIAACVGVSAGLAIGAGGSLADALTAGAFSAFTMGVWNVVGGVLDAVKDTAVHLYYIAKPIVHGAIQGALDVVRGGEFSTGFITGALGAIGGLLAVEVPGFRNIKGWQGRSIRSAIAGAFGGVGSKLTGGKFTNGFVSAAFAHMWNQERHLREPPSGTKIAPYGEKLVPLSQVPHGSKQVLQYRVFFYDEITQSWWVGFHGPAAGTEMVMTYNHKGDHVGFAISPPGSPAIERGSGLNPISGIRIGFRNATTGLPYFSVFNSTRQPISPVTGKSVPRQSDFSHYPIDPIRPVGFPE